MNRTQNLLIGVIVILTLVIAIIGYNFLSGREFFGFLGTKNVYYVKYSHVNGLTSSNYVTLRGFNIGKVMNISFTDERVNELLVSFTIEKKYKIPKNSVARIVSIDLMGTRAINILPPVVIGEAPVEYIQSGDTLAGSVEGGLKEQVSEQVRPLKAKTENLLSSIDSMVNIIKLILNEKNRRSLSHSIHNIQRTMNNLAVTTKRMENLITKEQDNLENIIENTYLTSSTIKENNENIDNILTNLSNITSSLNEANLGETLLKTKQAVDEATTFFKAINKGEGSLGALTKNEELYDNLTNTSMHLERILSDFRRNPKKYINFSFIDFGKRTYYDEYGNRISKKEKKKSTLYSVQILFTSERISLNNRYFKGRKDVKVYQVGKNKYRYTIGQSSNYRKMNKLLKKLKDDFPDAFIIEVRAADLSSSNF